MSHSHTIDRIRHSFHGLANHAPPQVGWFCLPLRSAAILSFHSLERNYHGRVLTPGGSRKPKHCHGMNALWRRCLFSLGVGSCSRCRRRPLLALAAPLCNALPPFLRCLTLLFSCWRPAAATATASRVPFDFCLACRTLEPSKEMLPQAPAVTKASGTGSYCRCTTDQICTWARSRRTGRSNVNQAVTSQQPSNATVTA